MQPAAACLQNMSFCLLHCILPQPHVQGARCGVACYQPKLAPENQRRSLRGRAPAKAPAELRPILARGARAGLLGAVALAVTAKAARRAIAARRAAPVALQRPRALLEGGRHNLGGQVQELSQELNARVGQKPAAQRAQRGG